MIFVLIIRFIDQGDKETLAYHLIDLFGSRLIRIVLFSIMDVLSRFERG